MAANRIFISGASGFVGRNLVSRLLKSGQFLTVGVQSAQSSDPRWRQNTMIRIVETGPLESAVNLSEALADATVVVHLAGLAHVTRVPEGKSEAAAFTAANDEATARLAKSAVQAGSVHTFIHLSSIASVAENAVDHLVDDNEPANPRTFYGMSKRSAELQLLQLVDSGVFAISLRPPLIIGADARGNWAALQKLAWSGMPLPFATTRNRRSLISIDTLTEAIMHLARGNWPVQQSGSYNIADEGALSLAELVTELRLGMQLPARLLPFPPSLLYGAASLLKQKRRAAGLLGNLEVDGSRFNAMFSFEASHPLRYSVRKCGLVYRKRKLGKRSQPNANWMPV